MGAHRYGYKKWSEKAEGSRYTSSFEILKYPSASIELVESFPCKTRDELNKREGEIIKGTENCVNRQIAGRNMKEWIEANREHIAEKQRALRDTKKDRINDNRRITYRLRHSYCFLD